MYKLIKEKRKSITIKIDEELNIIIKAPYQVDKKYIEEMLEKNKVWIEETIKAKKEYQENTNWIKNKVIRYLGKNREICIVNQQKGKNKISYENDKFYFFVEDSSKEDVLKELLERYIRLEAKQIFEKLTDKYSHLIGYKYGKISLRKQKTRWGSCSSQGNLSYNIKLICAPIECIEYVVLHEVMHLKHFNHSEEFWRNIEEIMPEYKQRKAYLKANGKYFNI